MLFRVSEVESFRQWRDDEEADIDVLVSRLRGLEPPSEAMMAGMAFHRALELADVGEADELEANGYRFLIECNMSLALPQIRELRASKDYGDITITGQVDALHALRVEDHKTTGRFDPDRYIGGYQWRYYLDIFGASIFRWNVFEIAEVRTGVYSVFAHHTLEQYRYPGMHADCARLANELREFAMLMLPERRKAA